MTGGGAKTYPRITYDYSIAGVNGLSALGTKDKPFRFVFMSGEGVVHDEAKVGMFTPIFAQVKGKVERELVAAENDSFKTVTVRPGGIVPTPEVSQHERRV